MLNTDGMSNIEPAGEDNFIPAAKNVADFQPEFLKRRIPLYHPDLPFVVLWSEKSACTTIVKWFFLQAGLLETALALNAWVHKYEVSVFKARPGYAQDVTNALKAGIPVVKFVRDPFTRAYSSYLSVCSRASLGEVRQWSASTRRKILKHFVGRGDATEYGFSFRQFLQWIISQDMQTLNPHVRQQHEPRDEYLDIRYYKIESLAETFRALEQRYKLPQASADYPEIFESRHFHKKASFAPAAARALLDFAVPIKRGPEFPFIHFDQRLARGTDFEDLMIQCFREDLVRYKYARRQLLRRAAFAGVSDAPGLTAG